MEFNKQETSKGSSADAVASPRRRRVKVRSWTAAFLGCPRPGIQGSAGGPFLEFTRGIYTWPNTATKGEACPLYQELPQQGAVMQTEHEKRKLTRTLHWNPRQVSPSECHVLWDRYPDPGLRGPGAADSTGGDLCSLPATPCLLGRSQGTEGPQQMPTNRECPT